MQNPSARSIVRTLVWPVYLPWAAWSVGTAMLLPVLPLYLRDAELSFTMVSAVLAATGVGAAVGGLPVGSALQRMGENAVLMWALVVIAVTTAMLGATDIAVLLAGLRLAAGAATAGIRLSRQAYVSRTVAAEFRGRAMSMMGGTTRLAFFVGPVIGGVLADQVGYSLTFVICGIITAAGVLPVMIVAGPGHHDAQPNTNEPMLRTLRPHLRRLLTVSVGPGLIIAVRRGRLIVIPLIADALGLSATAVGIVVAIGTGADLLLFPVSGYLMDRYGRLYATVPAFGLMGVGLLLLGAVDSTLGVCVAGAVIGVGNGLSAGTLLTIGGDLAPPDIRGPFLAGFGAMQDVGGIIGPLIVGWFADNAGLSTSAVVLGVVMFVAIAHLILVMGETRDIDHGAPRSI